MMCKQPVLKVDIACLLTVFAVLHYLLLFFLLFLLFSLIKLNICIGI